MVIQASEVGILNDSFLVLSGFCRVFPRALWGCWNRVFLPCWWAKAHGLCWAGFWRWFGVWWVFQRGCSSAWHGDTTLKGADFHSAPAVPVAASAWAPKWEILKSLNGKFLLICCDSAPVKQPELCGSLHVIEAFLVLFKLKWLFTLQQRKPVLYPGMWAGNRWTMIFHQPVCCQSSDSNWQRS